MLAGYAVPVIASKGDIVVAGSGKMKGYDPATGAEKWTCNTLLRTIMTSPVVQDDIIYIAVQSYGDSHPHAEARAARMAGHEPGQDPRPRRDAEGIS
jgi:outer membrane protein assembly factor BamB